MTGIEEQLRRAARDQAASAPAREAGASVVARAVTEGLLDVAYATLDTPLGPLLVAASPRGLLRLSYNEFREPDAVLEELARRVSPRVLEAPDRLDGARRELEEYFAGRRRGFDLPIDWALVGPFARRVLVAAAAIPYGRVATYAQIAAQAGSPRGARATGNALGANPVPIVVPCHRVLRSGGALGGYTGGLDRKRFLLALEGVPA